MAITMEAIKKLRAMTGAGLADVKKALTEAEGDMDKAKDILRQKGQAIAAKRADRETANGCVLAKVGDGFAAIIALKCETDFVANNADYIKLTQEILDAAVAAKAADLDAVKALTLSNGLCTLVQTNKPAAEQAHVICMQVAAMKPVALDENSVDPKIVEEEYNVAVEKSKQEQVQKAVEAALKKAGINPAHVDSEDHMESNMAKGWITAEDVAKAKDIIATVSAEKAASLNMNMIENIAKGRVNKFYKESCLLNQEFIQDSKMSVKQYLQAADKDLTVVNFKRFTLVAD